MNIGQTTPHHPFALPRPSFATLETFLPSSHHTEEEEEEEKDPREQQEEEDKREQEHNNHPLLLDSGSLKSIAPFPHSSVNLISCTSNSGKTFFLDQVIRHRRHFFPRSNDITRLVYVSGNSRDSSGECPWSEESLHLEIISLSLEEFSNYTTHLEANTLLVVDDILKSNSDIEFIVRYAANHYSLAAVFLVTQSSLSSSLYSLIPTVHNIILLFGNSNTTRLAQHLVQTFFLCSETKKYLKSIFGLAEKQHDIVVLKLNSVASDRLYSSILAFCQVRHLFDSIPYCIVYPELGHLDSLTPAMPQSFSAQLPIEEEYLNEAFVLLPASRVQKQKEQSDPNMLCRDAKEDKWNEMAMLLEDEIKSAFNYKRWNAAKNLARSMLVCPSFCFSENARTVAIENKPKKLYSVIDFINVATRRAGPGERPEKLSEYKPLMQVLLRNNVPRSYIINRLLLPDHQNESSWATREGNHRRQSFKRRQKRRDPYYDLY